MTHICPACESGTLIARVSGRNITFEGKSLRVENLQYSECQECGEKVVLPGQEKRNLLAYSDAKKAALGLWGCGKIEAFRKRWGLTQSAASKIFGGGVNAFSKYERGEVIHSKSMDLLMRVFDQVEDARLLLSQYSGVPLSDEPIWETIKPASAPHRRVSAGADIDSYSALRRKAANGDRWENNGFAHGC